MYKSLDNGYEVRAVVIDIYQAFDKLWRLGLYYILKQNGISSKLLNADFLDNRTIFLMG